MQFFIFKKCKLIKFAYNISYLNSAYILQFRFILFSRRCAKKDPLILKYAMMVKYRETISNNHLSGTNRMSGNVIRNL